MELPTNALNSNIRCIEINFLLTVLAISVPLNSNIRCIEIIIYPLHKERVQGWIVTLDVLKYEGKANDLVGVFCWIVTLDVLK